MCKYSNEYIIVDECGLYVVGYVFDRQTVKYIAYSNKDICSIPIIKGYVNAVNQKEKLEFSQQDLIRRGKIKTNHKFRIVEISSAIK